MINEASIYVENELRRLERQYPSKGALHREQWMRERSPEATAERRAVARWAADRLIGAGERLRSWSAPQPVSHRQ